MSSDTQTSKLSMCFCLCSGTVLPGLSNRVGGLGPGNVDCRWRSVELAQDLEAEPRVGGVLHRLRSHSEGGEPGLADLRHTEHLLALNRVLSVPSQHRSCSSLLGKDVLSDLVLEPGGWSGNCGCEALVGAATPAGASCRHSAWEHCHPPPCDSLTAASTGVGHWGGGV